MFQTTVLIFGLLVASFVFAENAGSGRPDATLKSLVDTRPDIKSQLMTIGGVQSNESLVPLRKKICEEADYRSCHAVVIDPDHHLAILRITPQPGQILNMSKITSDIKSLGFYLRESN